ncbi:hypothetical protein Hanom_Chr17g01534981 [Helianthus anomalus]
MIYNLIWSLLFFFWYLLYFRSVRLFVTFYVIRSFLVNINTRMLIVTTIRSRV